MKAGELTDKQRRFISEYLIDLNATQAAIRAGYSAKTADTMASRLFGNVKVKVEIDKALEERSRRTLVTQDSVLSDLREVADICMGRKTIKIMTIVKNAREGTAEPVEVEGMMFEPRDANRALELLGKHLGMFAEKLEVKGSVSISETLEKARKRVRDRTGK